MTDLSLSVRLRADGSGLVGQLKLSRAELENLTRTAREAAAQGSRAGAGLQEVERGAATAGRGARAATVELDRMNRATRETGSQARRTGRDVRELSTSERAAADGARFAARELERLARTARDAGAQASRAGRDLREVERGAQAAGRGVRSAGAELASFRNLLGGVGLAAAGGAFVKTADSMTLLRGRLALVVGEGEKVEVVFEDLFRRAQDARTAFDTFNHTYFRTAMSLRDYPKLAGHAAEVTSLLSKAARIGGAGMQEMNAGLLQLSQALASGELRGEEFRSVMENIPGVARAIAAGLGTTTGKLRELAFTGQLTTEVVVAAILSQAAEIERQFSLIPRTAGDAITQLRNELLRAVDTESQASGATGELVNAIDRLRIGLRDAAPLLSGFATALTNIAAFGAENLRVIAAVVAGYATFRVAVTALTAAQKANLRVWSTAAVLGFAEALRGNFIPAALLGARAMNGLTAAIRANPIGALATAAAVATGALTLFLTQSSAAERSTRALTEAEDLLGQVIDRTTGKLRTQNQELAMAARLKAQAALEASKEAQAEARRNLLHDRELRAAAGYSTRANFLGFSQSDIQPRGEAAAVRGLVEAFQEGSISAADLVQKLDELGRTDLAKKLEPHITAIGTANAEFEKATAQLAMLDGVATAKQKELLGYGDPGVVTPGGGLSGDAKEIDKVREAYERLAASLDPVLKRQFALAEATEILQEAFEKGVIPREEFERLKALAESTFANPDAAKWLEKQNEETREQIRLLGLSTREREIEVELARRVAQARADEVELTGEQVEQLRKIVAAHYDAVAAVEKRRQAEQAAVAEFERIWDNARENVQRSLADAIDDALGGRINSIKDFWKSFQAIGRRAIAETLAAMVFTGGDIPAGSALGGFGSIFQSIFGGRPQTSRTGTSAEAGPNPVVWGINPDAPPPVGQPDVGKPDAIGFAGGFRHAFQQTGELLRPLADGVKRVLSPLFDGFGKTFKSVFGRSVAEGFGRAFGGAQVGALVSGLGRALGINLSSSGAQIGGAIGSFIPIPGGSLIGSVLGGVVGKLFGKTPVARASFTTGTENVDTYKRGKADVSAATGLVGAARSQLEQIAESLGGAVVEGLQLGGLGMRKDKYVFDPYGQGKKFGKNKSTRYETPEEAIAAALDYAIDRGAIEGISERAARVLKMYDDLNTGLREAVKVVNLERFVDSFTNPFKAAALDFERTAAERVKIAKKYGFDVLQIEELNAKERAKFIEQQMSQATSSVKQLLDDLLLGPQSEGSAIERRDRLIAERDKLLDAARAGDQDAIDRIAELSAQLLDVSAEAFGGTGQFAADRSSTIGLLQELLRDTEDRIKAAQEEARQQVSGVQQNPQLTEANATLDNISVYLQKLVAQVTALRGDLTGNSAASTTQATALSAEILSRFRLGGVLW